MYSRYLSEFHPSGMEYDIVYSGDDDAGIPIIAMTADAFSENVAECLEAGMNGHIAKPIDINNVLKELRKIRQAQPDFTKRDDYEN